MPAFIDLSGRVYGRLTVIGRYGDTGEKNVRWQCRCACGSDRVVFGQSLRRGDTVSCGCYSREVASATMTKHGHSRAVGTAEHRTYKVWSAMHQRCANPKSQKYPRYGARGIKVCARWGEFENFLADMGPQPAGLTLEREDNDGGYEPGNCSWQAQRTQAQNRSTNHVLTIDGHARCVSEWARLTGTAIPTMFARIARGWPDEDVVMGKHRATSE